MLLLVPYLDIYNYSYLSYFVHYLYEVIKKKIYKYTNIQIIHLPGFFILDVIVAITYLYDGMYPSEADDEDGYWYCFTTVCLVLLPTIAVQIFSIRWHQMDEMMSKSYWAIHSALLGVAHR